jgi:hypothetical protein
MARKKRTREREFPEAFTYLAGAFYCDSLEESHSFDEWIKSRLKNCLDKSQRLAIRDDPDTVLDGSLNDEELVKLLRRADYCLWFEPDSGARYFLKRMRALIKD